MTLKKQKPEYFYHIGEEINEKKELLVKSSPVFHCKWRKISICNLLLFLTTYNFSDLT